MPEIDIWELDSHSASAHGSGGTGSGTLETTSSGQPTSGPFVTLIDESSWSRDDFQIALELAQLVVYVALAYAVLQDA